MAAGAVHFVVHITLNSYINRRGYRIICLIRFVGIYVHGCGVALGNRNLLNRSSFNCGGRLYAAAVCDCESAAFNGVNRDRRIQNNRIIRKGETSPEHTEDQYDAEKKGKITFHAYTSCICFLYRTTPYNILYGIQVSSVYPGKPLYFAREAEKNRPLRQEKPV